MDQKEVILKQYVCVCVARILFQTHSRVFELETSDSVWGLPPPGSLP